MDETYRLRYTPTQKQAAFHRSGANEVLYGGAAGGGKSYAICWDAFVRCAKYPRTHAYLFRRTFPELEKTLIQTMMTIVPRSLGRYTATRHELRLINGSVLHFCYMNDEGDSMLQYQGAEIQWLYFDELTHFTRGMYDYLKTRLRAPKSMGVTPCVRCASNPGGPGHAWVKAYFVDSTGVGAHPHVRVTQLENGREAKTAVEYIPATVRDNPHISPMYEIELRQKPRKLREALLEGRWDAFSGQAFPEFTDDDAHYADGLHTHVIAPFEIPPHWTRVVSFDHGYSRPFSVGVWAVDEEGRAYRYKELYGCVSGEANRGVCRSPEEIGEMIAGLLEDERREGIRVRGVADPAIWDRSRGPSVEEQIRRHCPGVVFDKGDNTRLAGKMQLHERLKFGEDGRPMLYVFSTCKDFIRTVPALCYDAVRVEDIDTTGEDHIYDETRYFLMSRPVAPRIIAPAPRRRDDPLGD